MCRKCDVPVGTEVGVGSRVVDGGEFMGLRGGMCIVDEFE
jgi:hypothetical protein